MAFTIPSDDELRRIFGLLSQEDIDEMTKQYYDDLAKAKEDMAEMAKKYDEDVEKEKKQLSKPMTTKKLSIIAEVESCLIKRGLSPSTADILIRKYEGEFRQWVGEYLVNSSHLTPSGFADKLIQAKEENRLVNK
ncbi:MAG TPA: hypothetical protein DCS83_07765 [Prevotella sp.]|mgnify:CR=1 FL=1|nr:hypothetical protein [Prevotella sp.]